MEGGPIRILIAVTGDEGLHGVDLGVQIIHIVDEEGLQGLGPLRGAELQDAVMALKDMS